jgi:mannose-6-phosphate isomerase-like protein (cupin superfamily)
MRFLVKIVTLTALAAPFLATAADEVAYFDAKTVTAGFEKGGALLRKDAYSVSTNRRTGPGVVEVHARDTDIMYVVDGSATMVTGGTLVDAKTTGPGETRAASVTGGETRTLSKGDVIVVPNGVPHWFQKVDKLINYYVIKVRTGS